MGCGRSSSVVGWCGEASDPRALRDDGPGEYGDASDEILDRMTFIHNERWPDDEFEVEYTLREMEWP